MTWKDDILGPEFEQMKIALQNDFAGKVEATLIRMRKQTKSKVATLYIHGFNDYFFQSEMAHKFEEKGANFYALDLRRYGRSFRISQDFNDIRDIKSYYEEISKAMDIIRQEGSEKIILMGHSTGGLIITLFAKDNTGKKIFDAVILNSPFYEFNMSSKIKRAITPLAANVGKIFPNIRISGALSKEYGESLHKDYDGEWDYNLNWKPNTPPPISLGWLNAIREGHIELRDYFEIKEPVLVLSSTATITDKFDKPQLQKMDAVLNIEHIRNTASKIRGNIEIVAIEDGMHDLVLSRKDVREKVYETMLNWVDKI